ncbi:MAG: hypothetical protein ACLU7M_01285 [Mediterraneibacter gnavus]
MIWIDKRNSDIDEEKILQAMLAILKVKEIFTELSGYTVRE